MMHVCDLSVCVVALLPVVFFSVMAARAEERLWKKCRRKASCLRMQQQIIMGKSHCR
jgi:hypothetical protein